MGFTPAQIDSMSIWQYFACVNGYIEANSTGDDKGMHQAEYDTVAAQVLALS